MEVQQAKKLHLNRAMTLFFFTKLIRVRAQSEVRKARSIEL